LQQIGVFQQAPSTGSPCETIASLPFGDGQTITGSCGDPSPMHFTGKEGDAESNLDNFGARYYSNAFGRWMSPDWSEKPEAVPYSNLIDPQSLNLFDYVRNNPVSKADADGHAPSDLVYDGVTQTITLYSSAGEKLGSWPAANNVALSVAGAHITHGPIQDGKYNVRQADRDGASTHLGGTKDSAFGKNGIIHMDHVIGATGDRVEGDGVHSGRDDKGGPQYDTLGCIRTTDTAMSAINATAKTDPLQTVTVQNNQQNVQGWQAKANIQPPPQTTLPQQRQPQSASPSP
jgi:RHS repeat-associated protein